MTLLTRETLIFFIWGLIPIWTYFYFLIFAKIKGQLFYFTITSKLFSLIFFPLLCLICMINCIEHHQLGMARILAIPPALYLSLFYAVIILSMFYPDGPIIIVEEENENDK